MTRSICPRVSRTSSRRSRIDAAIICTPTQLHFEQAITAFLEPQNSRAVRKATLAARTRPEIVELIAAAREAGDAACRSRLPAARRWATFRMLRQLVRSGEFGAVRAVMSHNIENWQQTIGGTWRDDPESNPGGFIGDAGSHQDRRRVFRHRALQPDERLRPLCDLRAAVTSKHRVRSRPFWKGEFR